MAGLVVLTFAGRGPDQKADLLIRVGMWPAHTRGPARDVATKGNYAYVAIGEGGMVIVDARNPAKPVRAGGYLPPGRTDLVRIVGNRAYVISQVARLGGCNWESWRGVVSILDISTAQAPTLLGNYMVGNQILNLCLDGTRMYLGINGEGLQIVDVTDPSRPVLLGTDPTAWSWFAMTTIPNQRLCFGDYGSLNLLDVSKPESPVVITNMSSFAGAQVRGIQFANNRLHVIESYTGEPGNSWLSLYDVPPGAAPSLLGFLELTNHATMNLQVTGDRAFAAASQSGLMAIDVSVATTPRLLGMIDTPGFGVAAEVAGTKAFVADFQGGLQIIDVQDPGRMTALSSFDTGLTTRELRMSGSKIYLLSTDTESWLGKFSRSRLEIIDVKVASTPVLLGSYEWPFAVKALDVSGELACALRTWPEMINGSQYNRVGLQLLDVSNPAQPSLVSETLVSTNSEFGDYGKKARLSGQYAFVSTDGSDSGISIFDLKDVAHPVRLSRIPPIGPLEILGDRLYVSGTEVYSITNPRAPVWLGSGGNGTSTSFHVTTNRVYVCQDWAGFAINDIQTFTNISVAGSYNTVGQTFDVHGDNNYLFAAEGWEGLEAFDVSQVAQPVPLGHMETRGQARDVHVSGYYAYVAEGGAGLAIMSMPPGPVTLIQDPENVTVAAGDSAVLSVQAYGRGDLTFQWYYGESGDVSHPILGATNPSLVLSELNQPGAYWVRVSCPAGFTDSRAAWVSVVPPVSVQLVGLWPGFRRGDVMDLQVSGDLTYVAAGNGGLTILDLRNPVSPRLIANYTQSGFVGGIAVTEEKVYLACNGPALQILDVSDPAQPALLGVFGTNSWAGKLAVAGTNAYLLGNEFQVLDISNPAQPRLLGSLTITGNDLEVLGQRAYITSSDLGLAIVDVSNPKALRLVSRTNPLGTEFAIAASGNFAYLGSDQGLRVIEITNAAAPNYRGQNSCGEVRALVVSGTRAYAAGARGFQILDVSNSSAPTVRGQYATNLYASALTVADNRAYVYMNGDLQVIDITDISRPALLGSLTMSGFAQDVALSGSYAFLADDIHGVQVLDVSFPTVPVPVSNYRPTNGFAIRRVARSEGRLYAAGDTFQVLGITVPAQPVFLGELSESMYEGDLLAGEGYVWMGGELRVVDVRNPAMMQVLARRSGSYDSTFLGGCLSGSYAYVAREWSGIQTYDFRVPAQPLQVGGYYTDSAVNDVAVDGNLGCATISGWDPSPAMEVLDFSIPERPARLGKVFLPSAERVELMGRYACVTGQGLQVIDIRDPSHPVRVGGSDLGVYTTGLQVSGDLVYVVAADYGLAIYRVTPLLRLNAPVVSGGKLNLSWIGGPGVFLQRCTDLGTGIWQDVPNSEGVSKIQLTPAENVGFFRLLSR